MAFDPLSRGERIAAWMVVLAMHAGLLWILMVIPEPRGSGRSSEVRMVLRLVPEWRAAPPLLHTPSLRASSDLRKEPAVAAPEPVTGRADAPPPVADLEPAEGHVRTPPVDWHGQARQWVSEQHSGPPPGAADPLRIGASASVGESRREAFRHSEPLSVHRVLVGIGQLFGGTPPSPCETSTANIPGLLTATSDRDRELLQEELRRQRRYCSR